MIISRYKDYLPSLHYSTLDVQYEIHIKTRLNKLLTRVKAINKILGNSTGKTMRQEL
jgi:hypothetical protein